MADMLVVCSPGGHFSEARSLMKGLEDVDYKFVIHLPPDMPPEIKMRVIVAPHAERDLRILLQLAFALRCVWRERPKVILSTGALIGVTFGLAGKLIGARFIFVESPTRVTTPSLAARICHCFADVLYVRHKVLLKHLPRGQYYGEMS
jgi:UDP-N-acetylglucosamine:LPS N-acetylglucosamine transferase